MAFFKKLKDRLFKSSSKIDEGLEAIVSDGGEADPEIDADTDAQRVAEAERQEAARLAQAEKEATERQAKFNREEVARAQARDAAAERARQAEAEALREAAETAAKIEEARAAEEAAASQLSESKAREAAEKAAKDREMAQAAAAQTEAEAQQAAQDLEAVVAAQARAAEAEARQRLPQAETPSEPVAKGLRTTLTPVAPDLLETETRPPEAEKPGLLGRLMGRGTAPAVIRRTLDDDMLEQLEELLITADMGVDTSLRVTANMAEGRFGRKLSVPEIKQLMADEIAQIMEPVARPLPLYPKAPQVVLVVGVNGSGKTTTIGKLASQFRAAGKKVVIAAGDTFRAAAVEQLEVWGQRAGVPVLTAAQGTDPASLAFDAMAQAQADGADLLLIDTAGRLQNRNDLMEELAKIVRVIRKQDESAPHNTLLVLDATTGQNAVNQVKVFREISDVSGLVMTKLDGTAKGGVLVSLADQFGLPIHAIGVGEQIDDLAPFDPEEFADALVGYDR
ncbi:MAG: signal recognition particle-docking protein FtsY [Pseudomonadota bacterium]